MLFFCGGNTHSLNGPKEYFVPTPATLRNTFLLDHNDAQAPQLGWNLSGFGSTVANSDYIDGIVSDLIQVIFNCLHLFLK